LKKRYFQIKLVEAASIRGLILEPRYRPLNNEYQQDENHRKVYILDCYKDIPQVNLKLNPKYRIIFDYNIKELNNVSNKNNYSAYTFELTEISIETSKNIKHLFVADCQKTFDDWYTTIEKLISLNKNNRNNNNNNNYNNNKSDMVLINEKLLSPITSLNSGSLTKSGSSNSATSSCTSSVSDASSSPNQSKSSANSSSEANSGRNSHLIDELKLSNNQQLIDNFDLEKVIFL
jgi:hypothetical protein